MITIDNSSDPHIRYKTENRDTDVFVHGEQIDYERSEPSPQFHTTNADDSKFKWFKKPASQYKTQSRDQYSSGEEIDDEQPDPRSSASNPIRPFYPYDDDDESKSKFKWFKKYFER